MLWVVIRAKENTEKPVYNFSVKTLMNENPTLLHIYNSIFFPRNIIYIEALKNFNPKYGKCYSRQLLSMRVRAIILLSDKQIVRQTALLDLKITTKW